MRVGVHMQGASYADLRSRTARAGPHRFERRPDGAGRLSAQRVHTHPTRDPPSLKPT